MEAGQTLDTWALVELMGHQKICGKATEATLAGGAFLRVDVPPLNGEPGFTRFYSPGSIYSISPVSEEIARGLMERYRNVPVSRFELPQIADKAEPRPYENMPGFVDDSA